jgi:dihydrofolate synthase / folylpolyglutamate synthase
VTPDGRYPDLVVCLRGVHQVENAALAIRAVELFTGGALDPARVATGLRTVKWPGRFDVLSDKLPLVVDGAHNPGGAARLKETLERYYPGRPVAYVLGASKGKDVDKVLGTLVPGAAGVVAAAADHPRAVEADEVARAARGFTKAPVETSRDLKTALIRARFLAGARGVVCVAGSLYLVGDALKLWPRFKASWSGRAPSPRRKLTATS